MTTRNRDLPRNYSITRDTYYWDYFSEQAGIPMPELTHSEYQGTYTDFENYIGGDLPGYRALIQQKKNAANPYFGNFLTTTASPGYGRQRLETMVTIVPTLPDEPYDVLGRVEEYTEAGQAVFVPAPSIVPTIGGAGDMAKAAFISKARRRLTAMQGGTFLGEILETVHMIRRPAQGIRDALSRYLKDAKKRSRGLKSPKGKNRVIAQTWLEYTFGWAPLVNDVIDGAKALARVTSRPTPSEYISGSGQEEESSSFVVSCGLSALTWDIEVCSKLTSRSRIYGLIDLEVGKPNSIPSAFGLRPYDFLPTVWELIPYSFVIDYFTNIGDMISAVSFPTGLLRWVAQTDVLIASNRSLGGVRTDVPSSTLSVRDIRDGSPGSMERTLKQITRFIPDSLIPSLTFRLPGVKQGFNLGALLQQARSFRS